MSEVAGFVSKFGTITSGDLRQTITTTRTRPIRSSRHSVKRPPPSAPRIIAAGSRSHDAGHTQPQQQLGSSSRRSGKAPRRLITISTGNGRWNGEWSCDYLFTFRDLGLQDLIQDAVEQKDATVSVKLCVEKHASFGFSVDGIIITSFTKKCISCNSPYSTQIDTNVNVWVLPSSRQKHDRGPMDEFPLIGGDDPSVIYVKPGHEADLDSLVRDAVRLAISVKVSSLRRS
ncbi:unnamed protein product [Linum tenue]|uniref:Uncharacterized protein n=1 Tax=Linum tenue TaxID=586396 RepID=A0AAV0KC50_9ROSI|nr:unnamed protein product [Linum tenue]